MARHETRESGERCQGCDELTAHLLLRHTQTGPLDMKLLCPTCAERLRYPKGEEA